MVDILRLKISTADYPLWGSVRLFFDMDVNRTQLITVVLRGSPRHTAQVRPLDTLDNALLSGQESNVKMVVADEEILVNV